MSLPICDLGWSALLVCGTLVGYAIQHAYMTGNRENAGLLRFIPFDIHCKVGRLLWSLTLRYRDQSRTLSASHCFGVFKHCCESRQSFEYNDEDVEERTSSCPSVCNKTPTSRTLPYSGIAMKTTSMLRSSSSGANATYTPNTDFCSPRDHQTCLALKSQQRPARDQFERGELHSNNIHPAH